jgi:hypothetical protein
LASVRKCTASEQAWLDVQLSNFELWNAFSPLEEIFGSTAAPNSSISFNHIVLMVIMATELQLFTIILG